MGLDDYLKFCAGGPCCWRHRCPCGVHLHGLYLPWHFQLPQPAHGHQGILRLLDLLHVWSFMHVKPSAFLLDLVGQGCGAAIPSLRAGTLFNSDISLFLALSKPVRSPATS